MKIFFDKRIPSPEKMLMKKCGYHQIIDGKSGQISYVRLFGSTHYPRFHCYVNQQNINFQINLHLDQKAPSYGKQVAHSGEYDGPVVEREGQRIRSIVHQLLGKGGSRQPDQPKYSLMDFG